MNALATTATPPSTQHPHHPRTTRNITPHLALVTALAVRMARHRRLDLCSLEIDDLVAIGREALLDAARRYDPSRGAAFPTFAYYRVNGAMLDALRSTGCYPHRGRHAEKRDPVHLVSLEAHATTCEAIADDAELPDATADASATILRIRAAIRDLPTAERRLVEGYYLEELTLDDLGAELGKSRSWTCRLLQRGVATLRRALAAEGKAVLR